ncbi:hypothetical protein SAMN05444157_0444 [Frankineae bacterium MT45]|nr:hypothetical protein SAMN05444157_0444 [Frankineae bacterium MT45]
MTEEPYSPPPPSLPVPPNHPNEHGYLPAPPPGAQNPYPAQFPAQFPPPDQQPYQPTPAYFAVQPEPARTWSAPSPRRVAAIALWVGLALLSAGVPYLRFNGWTTSDGRGTNSVAADGWGRYNSIPAAVAGHDTVYGYVFAVAAVLLVSAAVLLLWRPASSWGGIIALMGSTFLFCAVCVLGLDVASRRSYDYVRVSGTYTATIGPGIWLALICGLGAAAGILLAIDVLLYARGDRAPAPSGYPSGTPGFAAPTGETDLRQDWTT